MKKYIPLQLLITVAFSLYGQVDPVTILKNSQTKDKGEIVHEKRIGTKFPVSDFITIDEEVLSSKDLRGKVVFINFWFKNCPPCIAEMKGLNKLYAKYHNENTVFIMISFENQEVIRSLKKEYNLKYEMISVDKEEITSWDVIFGYPSSFILDTEGHIVYARSGGMADIMEATKEVLSYYGPRIESQLANIEQ